MTFPIDFVDLPYPILPAPADGPDAFGDIAATTDANFAKVALVANQGLPYEYSVSTQATTLYCSGSADWHTIPEWPQSQVRLPNPCTALLLSVSAIVVARFAVNNQLYLRPWFTGDGILNPELGNAMFIGARATQVGASATFAYKASDLKPGGTVVINPLAYWSDADPTWCFMQEGTITLLAFKG